MADRCLLYYITDRSQFPGDESARRRTLLAKLIEATRAGVDYIQFREKDLSTRELETLARKIVEEINKLRTENRGLRTRLLVNSRTDVAFAVGADGVHLRSDDLSPPEVRCAVQKATGLWPLTTDHFNVAVSCHTVDEVGRAESEGADFAVFAPVFRKQGAPDVQPAGLAALREACGVKIPVLALGGITLENAAACLDAGAAGIAAIRLFQENNVEDVVRLLRRI